MTQDTIEERVMIDDPDALAYRHAVLRSKKIGIVVVFTIMVLACCVPLGFLQYQENAEATTLWTVTGVLTVLLLVAFWCYRVFIRQIQQDMQSNENIIVPAFVVHGWQTNDRRDPIIHLNIGNHLVKLPMTVMKRHVSDVRELNHLMPGVELMVEMTPHARVILWIDRV